MTDYNNSMVWMICNATQCDLQNVMHAFLLTFLNALIVRFVVSFVASRVRTTLEQLSD